MTVVHSQNGWTAGDKSLMKTYTVPGTKVRLTLRRGDAAAVLLYVAERFNREVENIDTKHGVKGFNIPDDWSYSYRPIRGSSTISNHASGTAMDLNATRHPLATSPSANFSAKQISIIHRILADTRINGVQVVRWGGDYSGRKDGMHFEINASGASVAALVKALKLKAKGRAKGGLAALIATALLAAGVALYPSTPISHHTPKPKPVPAPVHKPAPKPTVKKPTPKPVHKPAPKRRVLAYPHHYVQFGSHGAYVKDVQHKVHTKADGIFGPHTKAAVKRFQKAHHLAADGIVGPKTWAKLF